MAKCKDCSVYKNWIKQSNREELAIRIEELEKRVERLEYFSPAGMTEKEVEGLMTGE